MRHLVSNSGELALQAQGMGFIRAKVGDRYVLEALEQQGWTIGGEGSGHILVLDKHSTGDGLIAALQVLQAMVRSGKTQLQGRGRVLIRASGTEPLLRVMVEADNPDLTHQLAHDLAALV